MGVMDKFLNYMKLNGEEDDEYYDEYYDDDDDEIATFHAAQEEISTLETGAYVEG